MIGKIAKGFLRFYAGAATVVVTLLLLFALIGLVTGVLTGDRMRAAGWALAAAPIRVVEPARRPSEGDWKEIEDHRVAVELSLAERSRELARREDRVAADSAALEEQRLAVEEARRRLEADPERLRRGREASAGGGSDGEVAANLPFLSRMEAPGIVALMKDWDEARIVRYLRAMRSSKAAEVLDAMRSDPRSAARLSAIQEELKKAP
jgi:hypothetical protein